MAASLNRQIILGNLGLDPEVRYFPDGVALAALSVATTSTWKSKKTGEKQSVTTWHRVMFTGRLAEIARDHLKTGSQVYIEGETRTEKWQDKNTGMDRYSTVVRGRLLQMLGSGKKPEAAPVGYEPAPLPSAPTAEDFDDDIPF